MYIYIVVVCCPTGGHRVSIQHHSTRYRNAIIPHHRVTSPAQCVCVCVLRCLSVRSGSIFYCQTPFPFHTDSWRTEQGQAAAAPEIGPAIGQWNREGAKRAQADGWVPHNAAAGWKLLGESWPADATNIRSSNEEDSQTTELTQIDLHTPD